MTKEAFISGADDILTEALVLRGIGLRTAKYEGFKCEFSTEPLEGGFTAKLLGPRTLTYDTGDWDWGDLLDDLYSEIPEAGAKETKLLRAAAEDAVSIYEIPVEDRCEYVDPDPKWERKQWSETEEQAKELILPKPIVAGIYGNDYQVEETGSEGWLCPALLKFYEDAPETLYFAVSRLPVVEEEESNGA